MDDEANWDKLPNELLVVIAHKLSFCQDYMKLSAVSKSWNSILSDEKPLMLPPESPLLFLAEQVAQGGVLSCDFDDEYEEGLELDEKCGEDGGLDEEDPYAEWYDYRKNSIGNTRGLYSLATRKTYYMELPEASGKLILGTNKGWLVTLGTDFQINLLHPLLRQQIPLPPITTFPFHEESDFDRSIMKVSISSKVQPNKNDNDMCSRNPIVMVIFGTSGKLGFARLGDKVWTNVEILSPSIENIAYYKGKFYAVNLSGAVFVCDIDDDYNTGGRARGTQIASCTIERYRNFGQRYLVESVSGLWLVLRICKLKEFKPPHHSRIKYRTADFLVWKLELKYSDDPAETPSCACIPNNNLGDQAFFIGKATGISLPSSEYINPNCIYFTDDTWEPSHRYGGGHDMGIFNMESRTIEPYYQKKSIHPISPPLWYI